MIHPFQRTNIVAVQDNFPFQFVPVLLDVVVFNHDNNHIYFVEELVKVQNLILDNLLCCKEGVKGLKRTSQMTLLNVEHLESRALADVVDVLLICQAIKTDSTVVGEVVLFHDFMDTLQHEHWLIVVGLHGLVYHLGKLRIVSHEEPCIPA